MVSCTSQPEDDESARRQMQEKISDLERRLSRDVAASSDVDSLRAELHIAKTKIDQMQTDDGVAQYDPLYFSLSVYHCLAYEQSLTV